MDFSRLIDVASFKPLRIQAPNSWCGHLHFAAWIIQTLNPRIFVELGTHSGNSYLSFCQAIKDYGLSTQCYAVDTWQGDEQAGYYGEEIFTSLYNYHNLYYSGFSRLLRMSFDEAVQLFEDNSINFLHIDGLHTYDAVRHDFETWLPKLAPDAIVMFHDTNVYTQGFGVWKYWAELKKRYPAQLEFLHSYGLGVIQINDEITSNTPAWLAPNSTYSELLQKYFYSLGNCQIELYEIDEIKDQIKICKRDKLEIVSLNHQLADRNRQIANLNLSIADRERKIEIINGLLYESDLELASTNYRLRRLLTPVRMAKRFFTGIFHPLKSFNLARDIREIKTSKLFDTDYYLSQYREVRMSAIDPIRHYCLSGWKEGRNPSALFNTNEYLKNNPDVAAVEINPFVHYIKYGIYENRHHVLENTNNSLESESICSVASINLCHRAELMLQASDGIRRILVIDYAVPTPDMDSGSARMFGILRIMAGMGFSVTFAADQLVNDAKYIEPLNNLKINVLQGYSEIHTHLYEQGNAYSVVIISRPEVAERYLSVVRAYAAQAELDYDTVDLHYLRLIRGAELSRDPDLFIIAERYRQLEMLCCTSADRVFAITETEKKVILQNWPNTQVEVIPNIHSICISAQPWLAREGLVFIGGYDHTPNVDAVVWFVQEVMPIITKNIPSIRFTILGSRPTEAVKSLVSTNVEVIGWVPDPEPYFSAARVFVAPLRYGAGMKGKVGQAMSLGLPVVTTNIGAEGMGLKHNIHALIADTPETFAAAVIRLHNDEELWKRIQRNSVTHIDKNFSESAVESILREIWAENVASHESAFGVSP